MPVRSQMERFWPGISRRVHKTTASPGSSGRQANRIGRAPQRPGMGLHERLAMLRSLLNTKRNDLEDQIQEPDRSWPDTGPLMLANSKIHEAEIKALTEYQRRLEDYHQASIEDLNVLFELAYWAHLHIKREDKKDILQNIRNRSSHPRRVASGGNPDCFEGTPGCTCRNIFVRSKTPV